MSFKSLVNKLMKEGKSKAAATKIAGSVANAKMKGAGSGPTAKQKARSKSPATKKPKPRAVIRDKDRVADKSRSYTDKKGRKIEIKTFKAQKKYDSGVKDDPNKPSMKRKSSRLSNTVELHKTKTKKDGTTKTKVKRAAGGGKKSQRLHTKFAKGKNKEGSSDVTIARKSPTTMKKQGYNARLDDSLGAKNGKKKQSMKSRRDESEGMEKKMGKKKFSGNKSSAQGKAPAKMSNKRKVKAVAKAKGFPTKKARGKNRATKEQKMEVKKALESMSKSPAKKPLVGKQKSLPKELQEAILKSPAKMLTKSGIKMMDKSPMNMKTPMKKSKQKVEQDYARNAIADYKAGKKKEAKYEKKKALEVAAGEGYFKSPAKIDRKTVRKAKKIAKQVGKAAKAESLLDSSYKLSDFSADQKGARKLVKKSMKAHDKSQKLRRQGYRSSAMMKTPMEMKKNPMMMKSNQDGGGYAAKNPAAPARQLKKLGSVLSKHMKSN
jgi:hypothetical protein